MGALLDAAPAPVGPTSRRRSCGMAVVLDGPHGEDLALMLANPDRWSHVEVAAALRRVLGSDTPGIGKDAVGRHRRRDCPCRI